MAYGVEFCSERSAQTRRELCGPDVYNDMITLVNYTGRLGRPARLLRQQPLGSSRSHVVRTWMWSAAQARRLRQSVEVHSLDSKHHRQTLDRQIRYAAVTARIRPTAVLLPLDCSYQPRYDHPTIYVTTTGPGCCIAA